MRRDPREFRLGHQRPHRDALVVKNLLIDDGPRLKRFRPRSRGMISPYMHRTCHITAVVEDRAKE